MGGGGSKPAEDTKAASPPAKSTQKASNAKDQQRNTHAHSAPVRRESDASARGVGARRGSMKPVQGGTNTPRAPTTNNSMLNSTHNAMHRGSTVARTRLTRDKVKGLNRDEFDTDDDDDVDVFGREANAEAMENSRRKGAAEKPVINFGRHAGKAGTANQRAAIAMGNEAAGDLSGAAANNLAGGVGKKDQGMVKGTTVTGRRQRAFFNNDEDLEEEPDKTTSALAKAKQKAKTVGVQQELQRRQTARNEFGGTLNQTKSFGGTLSAQTNETPMINGTPKVKTLIDNMRQFRFNMRQKRDMSDTDIQDLHAQQQQYANVKIFMAKEIASIGRRIDIMARQVKDHCIELVDSIIAETDTRGGNLELIAACMKHLVTIPWTQECLERNWLGISVRDGSAKFFDLLLQLPMINDMEIALDPVALLEQVVDHKTNRIALALVFLKHWSTLSVAALKEEMKPHWQRLFVEVASHKRAIHNEDRSARMSLINKIVSLSHLIALAWHAVDPEDDMSIITRTITEGDATLVSAIVSNAHDVDWNWVDDASGHSALSRAIAANHKGIVELVLGARGIDPLLPLPVAHGHALDYAKKLNSHPAILTALEHKIAAATGASGKAAGEPAVEANSHAGLVARRRKEAAEKLVPEVPDFVNKLPSPTPAGQDTPDWAIDTSQRPIVATEEVVGALNSVIEHQRALAEAKRDLLSDAKAEARFFELEEATPHVKKAAAETIIGLGSARISVEGKGNKEFIAQFVDKMLEDQETENNCMLVRVVMYRVITVDFAPLISSNKWAVKAMQAGVQEVLDSLLKVPKLWVEEDVVELFEIATAHPTKRIPLCNQLLRHHAQLRLSTHSTVMRAHFHAIFDGIADLEKALPGEDRSERKELLYRLFGLPFITLQFEQEFGRGQTVFSRACRDGDIDLVKVLVELRVLRDVNRVHSNKSTALMQAVVGNRVEVVQFLAADPSVNVALTSPHGTALELAQKMRKDHAIIAAIKSAGGSS